jgi:hypothetical protein
MLFLDVIFPITSKIIATKVSQAFDALYFALYCINTDGLEKRCLETSSMLRRNTN